MRITVCVRLDDDTTDAAAGDYLARVRAMLADRFRRSAIDVTATRSGATEVNVDGGWRGTGNLVRTVLAAARPDAGASS